MARDGWGVWFWPVPSSLGNQTALLQLAATSNTPPPLFWEKGGPRYSLEGNNSIQIYNQQLTCTSWYTDPNIAKCHVQGHISMMVSMI